MINKNTVAGLMNVIRRCRTPVAVLYENGKLRCAQVDLDKRSCDAWIEMHRNELVGIYTQSAKADFILEDALELCAQKANGTVTTRK